MKSYNLKPKLIINIKVPVPKIKPMKATVPQLLRNVVLNVILAKEYKYETIIFGGLRENKTPKGFLKIIFKTIEYRHDLVYNDILSKQFNGVKTFITTNTQMHNIFRKVNKAKPLSIFSLKFKKILALSPKLKEFYNLTGHTVGFKVFQFFDNKKYNYTHNLKTYGESRKAVFLTMLNEITTGLKTYKTAFIIPKYRKTKFRVRFTGFKIRLYNPTRRMRSKIKKLKEFKMIRDLKYRLRKSRYKILFNRFKQNLIR